MNGGGRVARALRTAGRTWGIALVIVLVASALRVHGLRWDLGRLLHPDERHMAMVTAGVALPATPAGFIVGDSTPLNPRTLGQYTYGLLPVTVTKVAATLAGAPGARGAAHTGRVLSVLADLVTLLAVGWMARRWFGPSATWLAMSLYACAVLPIQHAHFFVVDPWLTAACTVAVAALLEVHQRGSRRAAALAGVATAAAVACKLTGVLLLVLAALVAVTARWPVPGATPIGIRRWVPVFLVAFLVGLRVLASDMFAPWSLWPSPRWLGDMRTTLALVDGLDWPPAHQWARRARWYPWWNAGVYGLGASFGLTALVGLVAGVWKALASWRHPVLVPAAWAVLVVATVSAQIVTTMRYLLPAYPVFALLAGWLLAAACRRTEHQGRARRRAALVLTIGVVATTAAWALAFTHIYRELHPRLRASRWIYDHVAPGAVIAVEHWDDALPITASRRATPDLYRQVTLPVADEDTPVKRDTLLALLDRAEYVVLSSDRNAGSLVRLPERFPMMARYYTHLADGSLGFGLVADIEVRPRLGTLVFDDSRAEEAFTVYDHPRVRIFRKTPEWSLDQARALIDVPDWEAVVRLTARQATAMPGMLQMPSWRTQQLAHEGTWRASAGEGARFPDRQPGAAATVLRWTLALMVVWACAWPLCWVALADTWARGTFVAPAVGLTWWAWATWAWGSVTPWPVSHGVMAGALLVLGALSLGVAWPARRDILPWLRQNRLVLGVTALALAGLGAGGLLLRMANPDLWHPMLGGEKPMDIALLNAVVRADRFPPADPWFAGGVLNYYYFGYVPVAVLCRVTGVEPAIAYNLAVPTWWVLVAAAAASAAGTLAMAATGRARVGRWAALGSALAVVAGNLTQWGVVWQSLHGVVPEWAWFWAASRAIPAPPGEAPPITEFPFFTVLFADLHAHLLSMPSLLTGLVVATLLAVSSAGARHGVMPTRAQLVLVLLGGLLLGTLSTTNPWDVPALALLMGAAILLHVTWGVALRDWPTRTRTGVVLGAATAAVAYAVSYPFWSAFGPPAGGFRPWRGSRTPLVTWLVLWGPFALPLAAAAVQTWRMRRTVRPAPGLAWLGVVGVVGLALVTAVEVVHVRGDVSRMNTVFKTYLAVWLVWSAAAAAALARLEMLAGSPRSRMVLRTATLAGLGALLVYPATAIGPRVRTRMTPVAPTTLDGRAFMRDARWTTGAYDLPLAEDARTIDWLLTHARGTPTIMEAQTDQYQWGGRISAHTGLPTVLGWTWHARQQRMGLPAALVARRRRDVRQFYSTPSMADADRIARRYDVRYLVVGRLERALYPGEGLDKFARSDDWRPVFRDGATVVYERRP